MITQSNFKHEFPELLDGVRAVVPQFDSPCWQEIGDARAFPDAFVTPLTQASWLAGLIPEKYRGPGLSLTEASVVMEEINRAGANSGACHGQRYVMGCIVRHGSEKQKPELLPRIAIGELRMQSIAVTEPTIGCDTTQLKTTDVLKGDRYAINGQKVWTSRPRHSDFMLLLARTAPLTEIMKKCEGLSAVLVDLRKELGKAIHEHPNRNMVSHETNEIFTDKPEVPVENRIREEVKGLQYILDGLNAERVLIPGECIGDGDWFTERASSPAHKGVVFHRQVGVNQGIQFPIARAVVDVEAAGLMRYRPCELFDAGAACGAEANMSKRLAAYASWEVAHVCVKTYGGFGFVSEDDTEREFRETCLYQTAPISTNPIFSCVGEHMLGLPRSH